MTADLSNFFRIERQKRGLIRVKHDVEHEANIYKLLYDFGFRKARLDNRPICYRRSNNEVMPIQPTEMKDAFLAFLKGADYSNLQKDLSHHDILEWFYSKSPIRQNSLFDYYLESTLSEQEAHSLRLQTNDEYKHRFEIKELIAKLVELGFSQTVDSINSYSRNKPPLYYKHLGNKNYIVLNHWNFSTKSKDGFDCWLANYADEKQIGIKEPADLQSIKSGFVLSSDFRLIEQYLHSTSNGSQQ